MNNRDEVIMPELHELNRSQLEKIAKKKQIGLKAKDFNVRYWKNVSDEKLINKIKDVVKTKNLSIQSIVGGGSKGRSKQISQRIRAHPTTDFNNVIDHKINALRQEIFNEINTLKSQLESLYQTKEQRTEDKFHTEFKHYKDNSRDFFSKLRREFNNIPIRERVGIRAPIYLLRDNFCRKYNISKSEFDKLVIQQRDLGNIELQPGSSGSSFRVLSSTEADYYWISFKG